MSDEKQTHEDLISALLVLISQATPDAAVALNICASVLLSAIRLGMEQNIINMQIADHILNGIRADALAYANRDPAEDNPQPD